MKWLKFIAILFVGVLSVSLASYFTSDYVSKKAAEEKTLAEAIIENQLRQELEKAEEEARKKLGEQLITTAAETKPIEVITTAAATTVATVQTTVTTTTVTTATAAEPEEEIKTEFTRGNVLPKNRDGIGFNTIFTLTEGEQERLTRFLIERYFLDGSVYAAKETRPKLKEKKALAAEMENNAIAAVNLIMGSVNLSDMTTLMTADYDSIYSEITALKTDFSISYSGSEKYGAEFGALYDNCIKYFDRLLLAVERLNASARKYSESTNAFLAAIVLASAVDEVIIPEILAVLEESFGLIEVTQDIFLEGTTGTALLSREEVTEIITNPALVLNTGLA